MDQKICGQCAHVLIRSGCKVCFKKGKSLNHCLNFYPRFGTRMFLKWLRLGKLRDETVEAAKRWMSGQDCKHRRPQMQGAG